MHHTGSLQSRNIVLKPALLCSHIKIDNILQILFISFQHNTGPSFDQNLLSLVLFACLHHFALLVLSTRTSFVGQTS